MLQGKQVIHRMENFSFLEAGEDECHGYFFVYKTVPGKADFASQLGKLCLEKVAPFIMKEATSFFIREQKGLRF